MIRRKKTKVIHIGSVPVGGKSPVSIQSMTKTDTCDVKATVKEIRKLQKIGCEIIRVAVPDIEAAKSLPKIIKQIQIPLVADIHFNWRLATKSIENGAAGIRINPGNLGKGLPEVIRIAKDYQVPVRIGVNSGSLDKKWLKKYKGVTTKALVASALEYIKRIEDLGYNQLKISIKAPDVERTIKAYRLISQKTNYPLHLGVTEAGTVIPAAVRSSIALGTLLREGIGDTIRVSVTGAPEQEIIIAKEILQSLGLRSFGPQIISCPTCGRCKVDLIKIVEDLEKKLFVANCKRLLKPLKVAVMGCVVNGPGEAKEADIGIACGRNSGVLFKKGKQICKVVLRDISAIILKELVRRK